jgi:hypothetical protein
LAAKREREPEAVNAAVRELETFLSDGPKTGDQLRDLARDIPVSLMTLRRAKERLGVLSLPPKIFGGPRLFKLPDPTDDFENDTNFG